jgi:hypothetical protein
MVTGSVAAIYYGEPRMTNDVDIVVFLRPEDALRLEPAFPQTEFYCPPRETIQIEQARGQRGHFNLIHHESGFKADIYLAGAEFLHSWGLARRHLAEIEGDQISFTPPEYVILRKLQFYREGKSAKHLRDIHRMINIPGPEWDKQELLILIREHRVEPEWQVALEGND